MTIGWENITSSIKYTHEWERFNYQAQVYYTHYTSGSTLEAFGQTQIGSISSSVDGYDLDESYDKEEFQQLFKDLGMRHDVEYRLSNNISFQAGGELITHNLDQESILAKREYGHPRQIITDEPKPAPETVLILNREDIDTQTLSPYEYSLYTSSSIKFGQLSIFPGIRYHRFEEANRGYFLPRLNIRYDLNDQWFVSTGYGHFVQNVQSISLDLVRVPNERWFWTDENRQPAQAKTYTAGIGNNHPKLGRFSLEGYYKKTTGLINFSPQAQSVAINFEFLPLFGNETVSGVGESYGIEALWMKTQGRITGWLGYTWSRAWEFFPELNNGARFPSRTDRPHDLQLFLTYQFNENWSLGALFNYKTGQPITYSGAEYQSEDDPLGIGIETNNRTVAIERNNFRLPDYHRLDMNLTWKNRVLFKREAEWSLNVVNVYNRFNILTVSSNSRLEPLPNGKFRMFPNINGYGQMPILPTISLRLNLANKVRS